MTDRFPPLRFRSPALRYTLLVFGILLSSVAWAQSRCLLFTDPDTVIGRIEDGQVFVDEQTVLFSLQGNLLYEGASTDRDDILLMMAVKDLFGKKTGKVFFKDADEVAYSVRKGGFFLGRNQDQDHLLGALELDENGAWIVYDGITREAIGRIVCEGDAPRDAELIAAFHLYLMHYDLDRRVLAALDSLGTGPGDQPMTGATGASGVIGLIRPAWGNNPYMEWSWDGRVLKPAWGIRAEDEWSFDGRFLRPLWSRNAQEEWTWDGQMLRRTFSTDNRDQWIWEGEMLRPFWDNTPERQWRFDGSIMRPWWNSAPALQWAVEGEVPLPVLAIVILGIADR